MKILQKNLPDEEFLIRDFRIENRRQEFAERLEITMAKKSEINRGSPPETDRGNVESRTSHQKRIQVEIETPNFVEGMTPGLEEKSNLPWVIAEVLLLGILTLLFKVIKGKSTS